MQDFNDDLWQGQEVTTQGAKVTCGICHQDNTQCQCIPSLEQSHANKHTLSANADADGVTEAMQRINIFAVQSVKTCDANKAKNKHRRKRRGDAMAEELQNKAQRLGIQGRRLDDRTKITDDTIAELELKAALMQDSPSIYCKKTGAVVGRITAETMAALDMVNAPENEIELLQNNGMHPAWLNTSPERLRDLQRIMPHHYVIYCYYRLTEKLQSVSGKGKNTLLTMLQTQPLRAVVECAELLRTALGLLGRHKPACSSLPSFNVTDLHQLNIDVRYWLAKAVLTVQKSHHAKDIDRQRTVTLADVARFKMDIGYSQFGNARIGSIEDDALLLDLTEIFGDADMLTTSRTYNAPKIIKAKEFKFETKLQTVDNKVDGMLTITFATQTEK